ncbi:glycosyltransferase family protein [Arthrobacter sp. Leaf69]|uniref:glycosyltransferase family protein n=1 Tax=Arthrobacter sp. Leaf69 TaxID=1736232 RepID=UPI0009EC4510|nr:glycosyltransferase [Arthrobacter sp. Leaf69]
MNRHSTVMASSASARPRDVGRFRRMRSAKGLSFTPAVLAGVDQPNYNIRAAVILDEFSSMCFDFEWNSVAVTPEDWRSQITENPVDILFVESAWAGNSGAWKYHLTGSKGPSDDLIMLVDWCRERGIPTVFWNKEDPPHYTDFLETARLFDSVFTSDATRIPHYLRDLGHDRVCVLPFAAQPKVHNPIRPKYGWHSRDIAFAGMYFRHKFPERREQMEFLLSGAMAGSTGMDFGLEIFSRMLGGDERYQFPEPFASKVVGQLPYPEMLTAYKAYKVFLNVNSVIESPSMCARRIFEISASGTPVVSAPSLAIREFFPPEEVFVASDVEETRGIIRALVRNSSVGERAVHLAQRRVWSAHTYSHRVQSVLDNVGISVPESDLNTEISCMISTNRPSQLDHIFKQFSQQIYAHKQLVLLTHGFAPDAKSLKAVASRHGIESFVHLNRDASHSLGACLNAIVSSADGTLVTKMDDDDLYGHHYLSDLVYARAFSGAEVVGKSAHYMHLQESGILLRRFRDNEHRFVSQVMGPTITGSRDLFSEIPFGDLARGEDTDFLSRVRAAGGKIYAADRYNFVQVRGPHTHTWRLSDMDAISTGDVELYGDFSGHVFL